MKKFLVFWLFFGVAAGLHSCNKEGDDDFPFSRMAGVYHGSMSMPVAPFFSNQFNVMITQFGDNAVRISPMNPVGTEWFATMVNLDGEWICSDCDSMSQISFTEVGYNVRLTYDYNGTEQFEGLLH